MSKVIAVGNALVDILVMLENDDLLTQYGLAKGSMQLAEQEQSEIIQEATKALKKHNASGGSAANTIHGLACLGVQSSYIGKIGNDKFGLFFEDDMKEKGIVTWMSYSDTATGIATALVSQDTERTFSTYLGAAVELTAEDIKEEWFDDCEYLYLEGYLVMNHDLMMDVLKKAKAKGMKTVIDLASYNVVESNIDFLNSIIKDYIDIVFANEEEAMTLTGKEPEEALDAIAELTDIAIVKLGKIGSLIKTEGKSYRIEGKVADAVDTTGAGDLYAAGFLYGLISGYSMELCGKIASLVSGNVVEVIGAKMEDERWDSIIKEIETILVKPGE